MVFECLFAAPTNQNHNNWSELIETLVKVPKYNVYSILFPIQIYLNYTLVAGIAPEICTIPLLSLEIPFRLIQFLLARRYLLPVFFAPKETVRAWDVFHANTMICCAKI
jgi:hypothetical protein